MNFRVPLPLVLALGLLPAGCGPKAPAANPGPGNAPPAPPAVSIPGSPASKVEWNPEALAGAPGEFIAVPGSGTTVLEGVVVDEQDRPVPGATVEMHALPKGVSFLAPLLHCATAAGPEGQFKVGPGPSPWWSQGMLSAYAPGFARSSLRSRTLTLPGQPCAEEGQTSRLVLHPGYPVKGQVRGKDGGPPDGIVTLWAVGPGGFFEVLDTDATGGFAFTAPKATITITAIEGVHPAAMVSVAVAAEGENRVTIPVLRGRDVRGTVLDAVTGKPIPGAILRTYYGATRLLRTGPDGKFLLPKIWFNAFQVRSPGYAAKTHILADDAGRSGVAEETIRLDPGFVARGKVLDSEGKPLPRARMRILTTDPMGDRAASAGPFSDPDGSFVFVGLPLPAPGREVRIFATAPECAWGVTRALPGTPGAVLDGVEVRIPRLVDLEGRVEDGAGKPVAADLSVQWDVAPELAPYSDVVPSEGRVRIGDDGLFRIRIPERSNYRIAVSGGTFAEAKAEGTSPAHGSPAAPLVLKVDRGLAIRGTVVDAEGKPVGRGDVRVEPHPPTDPRPSRDATIRPDGSFEAGGLTAGLYDISVLVHPEFLQEVKWNLEAGGPDVKVVLRRPGGLRFRAILPPEVPEGTVPEVHLRALEETRPLPPDHYARLDPYDPKASLGPLAPGPYTLVVTAGDCRASVDRVMVVERDPTDLGDLPLKPAGVVTGKVTLSSTPVAGAEVEVLLRMPDGTSQTQKRMRTNGSGVYRVGGLLPGKHLVTVKSPDRPMAQADFDSVTGEVKTLDLPLASGGRLKVTVKDAAGNPVPGAHIVFAREGSGVPAWTEGKTTLGPVETGPDGTVKCSGLPAGDFQVRAEKPGTGSGEAPVTVKDAGSGEVEVRFGK